MSPEGGSTDVGFAARVLVAALIAGLVGLVIALVDGTEPTSDVATAESTTTQPTSSGANPVPETDDAGADKGNVTTSTESEGSELTESTESESSGGGATGADGPGDGGGSDQATQAAAEVCVRNDGSGEVSITWPEGSETAGTIFIDATNGRTATLSKPFEQGERSYLEGLPTSLAGLARGSSVTVKLINPMKPLAQRVQQTIDVNVEQC